MFYEIEQEISWIKCILKNFFELGTTDVTEAKAHFVLSSDLEDFKILLGETWMIHIVKLNNRILDHSALCVEQLLAFCLH